MGAGHVVLLGDSILDNKRYVGDGPDVVTQLVDSLPSGWRATLLARDGDVSRDVPGQLGGIPRDATHLVVSVGGNDALGFAHMLDQRAGSVGEALRILGGAQEIFAANYATMVDALTAVGLPAAVCTIYDTPRYAPAQPAIRTGIALFNDCITRAAFSSHLSLIDLRLICDEDADYANPIEPSVQGGRKIARAITSYVLDERPAARPIAVTSGAV
jgi:hypothetical protein